MPAPLAEELRIDLERRRAAQLFRSRASRTGPQQPETVIDGRRVIAFCSNDYLGLANHPAVIKSFKEGVDQYGVGAGAAHLINGHTAAHQALEEELAAFTGRSRALLFSTGYMANLGVISALVGKADAVFQDRLNHASLLDAGKLSGARLARYKHRDTEHLDARIASSKAQRRLIATDGVFSMDGDLAPLPSLAHLARAQSAWLMVDDAHGLGVLGPSGRGTLEHFGLDQTQVPILMGTLGKALGTVGAFVAGSDELIETLIQFARTYIYTTASPPAIAEATRTSLRVIDDEPWRREKLGELVARFREGAEQLGLRVTSSTTPIQPLLIGDTSLALRCSVALLKRGVWVTAIRPPTVPEGAARLRITFSAAHTEAHIDRLLAALDEVTNTLPGTSKQTMRDE